MAKAKGGFSKSKTKTIVDKMQIQIDAAQTALAKLKTDLDDIQKGDGSIAYWSGEKAYAWITKALAHYDHDMVLIREVGECRDILNSLVKYGDPM